MMDADFMWSDEKNKLLQDTRWVCFEMVVDAMRAWCIISDVEHGNKEKYAWQRIVSIIMNDYVYDVPYVRSWNTAFLKTIIPSRKATKKFRQNHTT